MFCVNCGTELKEETKFCPNCGVNLVNGLDKQKIIPDKEEIKDLSILQSLEEEKNSLIGKKYSFISKRGTNITGIFTGKIVSEIEVGADRLKISIKPKKYNKVPAIMLEDITAIDITKSLNWYYWFFVIFSVIITVLYQSPICLIYAIIFIFLGQQRKIRVAQRNGKDVIIYSRNKELAETFKEDMKNITKIM